MKRARLRAAVAAFIVVGVVGDCLMAQEPAPPPPKPADKKEWPADFWSRTPDDSYAKVLAGKTLVEGVGFPGIASVGEPTGPVLLRLGRGREDFKWPFWYFYDQGPWNLTVCTLSDDETGESVIQAIILTGSEAPATRKGIKILDPQSKLEAAYGKPGPFTGSLVGLHNKGTKRVRWRAGEGSSEFIVDEPEEFQNPVYYPAERLAFAVSEGFIDKIAVIRPESPLPRFLRAAVKEWTGFARTKMVTDRNAKRPALIFVEDKTRPGGLRDSQIILPPPPPLVQFTGDTFTLLVPKGWALEKSPAAHRWTSPDGAERVAFIPTAVVTDETAEAILARVAPELGENTTAPGRRKLPPDFCRSLGSSDGWAYAGLQEPKGDADLPLAVFGVVLRKAERGWVLLVARQAHPTRYTDKDGEERAYAYQGSPDGEALARGVIRSLRLLK